MKKSLLGLLAVLTAFTACQKKDSTTFAARETVEVSLTASLSDRAAVKASSDGDGAGIYADRCKLQIWCADKLFYEETVPVSGLKARFDDISLIKDQTYDFLFWADNADGEYYVTDTLTNVKLNGDYLGCDDRRDAFFAAIKGQTIVQTFSRDVLLYRPFAQLNVITTDIPALKAQIPDDNLFAAVVPDSVCVTVTAPTVFNVKTGEASAPRELTYATDVYTSPYKTTEGAGNTLSMDYFLAPAVEGNLVEVGFRAKNTTSALVDIGCTFSNIPLRRNYRTNILGALLTVQGSVNVEVKPAWLGEIDR